MNLPLEMKVDDALHRIKDLYDKCGTDIVLSFSGGKDSTVVAELIKMAQFKYKLPPISFVFADTRLEYDVIVDFVKNYDYGINKLEILKPKKPFSQILRDYGKPAMSKMKSEFLYTYQNVLKRNDNPLDYSRTYKLIVGKDMKDNSIIAKDKLANKHFHFLNPNLDYKISNKCCDILKKKPFYDYYKENDIKGNFMGIRIEEGGVRAMKYTSCTTTKIINGREIIGKLPIFDWTDKDVNAFIKKYNISICKAYTEYGLERTGCAGCPFAKGIQNELNIMYKYEHKKYKAWTSEKWLRKVYMDLDVNLLFDKEYTKEKKVRDKKNAKVRYELLKKYRPSISAKWEYQGNQTDIFDFIEED